MSIIVRDFQPADAEAAAETKRAAIPYLVLTPELVAWQVTHAPGNQRHRLLVAEVDGQVVGSASTGIFAESSKPGQAFVNLSVAPDARGRGAGTALLTTAEGYLTGLGASTAYAWVLDDEASTGFAQRHGYQRSRSSYFSRLDLAAIALPSLPPLPEGARLRTAADFADDPRPLYDLDVEAAADEPGDVDSDAMNYEDWLALYWHRPDLDRDLTSVVVMDGMAVAFSVAQTDRRGRYWSGMTGTRRAYRNRGLAKQAKADSLRRARLAGCSEAFTGNDAENAPMLAINGWFGYQVAAREWRYLRNLTD
ncbi:GNAT family N-acetyltransferase [Micromonospora polyrhachis]|uniref:GNAT superfamily N-acetyltransferase n=1 Tax=Micromonospora polyrhachis TaxID=1282883 RepID=A0A7W7SVN6_9ACTN|nr:GNAT family N-acetyltransferase [Micromonospora polyrhachis]MBB4961791.1 GNAT superfamily N-acetyltransferase [Micromonospora polyrhachis]